MIFYFFYFKKRPLKCPNMHYSEYVQRFASASALDDQNEEEDDDDEMSSVGSFSDDEEPAGKLEV